MREHLGQLQEGQRVPLAELFPSDFMGTHTDASDIESFLLQSGQFVPEDLAGGGLTCTICETGFESPTEAFNSERYDRYVAVHTSFGSWDEMLAAAARRWLVRKLASHR